MRVNPNPLPDLLALLNRNQQSIATDEQQIGSGQSVTVPSDNPAAAAILVQNTDQTSRADQFQRSIGSIQGEMQNADSALNSVITSLQQAISLGTEGANGTVNATDRGAIASQVQGIQGQLLSLANLSYQGSYVFAGTATQTAPYALDPNSPSGVTYAGNAGVNRVTVGEHLALPTNLPGSQLFSGSGTDMFQAIQDLITNLKSGNTTGVGTAVNEINTAYNYIDSQRVFYGNAETQLSSQQTYLSSATAQLAQQANTVAGANLPAVISNLTTTETAQQATLEAIAGTSQTNLFNYVK
jgi:flagellar hook-associated protein 3 FlgL